MRRFLLLASLSLLAACHHRAGTAISGKARRALLAPNPAGLDAAGPDSFVVRVTTTKGEFDLMMHRDWAPRGSDRLYWLFAHRYYDGVRFFRTVPNFVTQFGMNGDSAVQAAFRTRRILDDTVRRSNVRGTLSFAAGGKDTRTTQLFINLRDNQRLDPLGFAVTGQVVAGMAVVDSLYQGYGDGPPRGKGPSQDLIAKQGEAYLAREFPLLDKIVRAKIVKRWGGGR